MLFAPMIAVSLLSGSALLDAPSDPASPAPVSLPSLADQYQASTAATSGMFLRLTGGLVTTKSSNGPSEDIDFNEGWLVSLGVGQRIGQMVNGPGFSLELEGVYDDQDADDKGVLQAVDEVRVLGLLLNGIVDWRIAERLMLYAGGGIGAAWLDVDTTNNFEDSDGPFLAWQLKAGVAWRFATSTAFHFGYRFMNIDDNEIDNGIGGSSFDLQTEQHVLEAGLIFGI